MSYFENQKTSTRNWTPSEVIMTQRQSGSDGSDPRHYLLRSPSQASDNTTKSVAIAVPQATPAPAYVARDAAAELIATEIERPVLVSSSALLLVNEFLDQVLYNILLASRSTTLGSLRAAVPTVLKPRLGKAAIKVAEEELREYLNDDEESELHTKTNGAELKHDFEPDLAWRLARLRCMVYTRLGDLEEEDEEDWLEKEGLRMQLEATKRTSQAVVETGPAAAIFLTSIIEYLGEQALYYAAQHAQKRHYQQGNQHVQDEEPEFVGSTLSSDDIVIGGKDMNHVGRDSPLSRLWRSYRRNTRDSVSRPMSPDTRNTHGLGLSHSRAPSSAPYASAILEERSPDQIPLPISGNDIDEIEVPGLASGFSDDEGQTEEDNEPHLRRRASMIIMPGAFPGALSPSPEPPEIPERNPLRPNWLRKRSISSPVPTLGKTGTSNRSSARRNELSSWNDSNSAVNRTEVIGQRRRPSSSHGQRSLLPTETIFGGTAAAVASALGMGSLGISRDTTKPVSNPLLDDEVVISSPRNVPQKKTVAEEMLSPTRTVPPPKDAKTGSSITNMSDFVSMHVPVAVSPDASDVRRSPVVTPSVSKGSGYFPATPTAKNRRSVAGDVSIYQNDGTADDLETGLRPAPLRTPSGRVPTLQPGTAGGGRVHSAVTSDVIIDSSSKLAVEPQASTAKASASRPQSSSSAALASAATAITPHGLSRDNTRMQHVKTDSRDSNNRRSSESNRLANNSRDATIRSPAATQPRVIGISNEEGRVIPSPSGLNVNRDGRPGTSSSSVSKRFNGKALQLGDESDEAKKKSLEILIRGNETLHYTLTPAAAMRDEQSLPQKARSPNQDMAEFLRNTSPRPQDSIKMKPATLNSSSVNPPSSPRGLLQRIVPPSSPRGIVTPVSPTTRTKNPFGEPRDARTESTPSVRDLADYARSTGPLDQKQLPQSIGLRTAPSPRLAVATPRTETPANEPSSPATNRASNRLKYQARDARPIRSDDSSELIDFIREGPPNSGREHRIDRRVAPFRTTMDSEDFNNLAGGSEMVASLRESEDSRPVPSVDPSIHSQTPLIVSNGQASKGVVPAAPARMNDRDADEMPKRTRRRIKDPYAIYDSDDDDLEEDLVSKNPRNQEESLIDFLRNTAPPPTMTTQPILAARSSRQSTEQTRSGSSARETSPHLTQAGSKIDKYRPTQPTHAAHVERNRSAQPFSPERTRSKPRFEARDAKATRSGTSELAEYLKNSGPAPSAQYQPQPFILRNSISPQPKPAATPPAKEDSNLFKRFSRQRKK